MERSEDAQTLANFDFKTVGLNCLAKVLTENEELDKRKMKKSINGKSSYADPQQAILMLLI